MERTIHVCQNCGESTHYFLQCPQRQNDKDKEGKLDRSSVYQSPRVDYSIRISNLSTDVNDEALENVVMHICNDVGIPIPSRCSVVRDRATGQSRGSAYVNYPSLETATQFINAMDGYHFMNRVLEVD
uniref:Eukaryotic translation initiation factor 3 subunit G n=1 Tax=Lygus hesperus TaxID=30085 RepID=A0A0A9VUQ7_LYGHE